MITQRIKEIFNSFKKVKPSHYERNILCQIQKYEHILQSNNRSIINTLTQ